MASREVSIWPVLGRKRVQEQSEQSFTVRFLSARALSAPSTARWKLTSTTTGETVVDWTAIASPGTSETVSVSGAYNTIRAGLSEESYEFVVESDYDDATARQSAAYTYKVCDIESIDN